MTTATVSAPRRQRKPATLSPVGVLTDMQARLANEIWTRDQFFTLAWHLHNGNGEFDFIVGWFGVDRKQDGGRPGPIYKKSRKMPVAKAIAWAWSSLCGKGNKKAAIVFYAQNSAGMSRWGSVDFDAHSEDPTEIETARQRAFDFFKSVLNLSGVHVILEMSGRGWHVWLLSKEYRPCRDWTELLAGKLAELSIPVKQGEVEVFPAVDTVANRYGYGMRAPGCWSPARQEPSRILWENIAPILAKPERSVPLKEKDDSLLFSSLPLYSRLLPLLDEFVIVKVSTRRKLLQKLCGQLFHQVGFNMAQRFAAEHFTRKQCTTKAGEKTHRKECGDFWNGLHQDWLGKLATAERTIFDNLTTDYERDAFRIVRSYAKQARTRQQHDFPIGRDDLAARIGMSDKGAGLLLKRFCATDTGIIERTQEYVPHKTAARYRWMPRSTGQTVIAQNHCRVALPANPQQSAEKCGNYPPITCGSCKHRDCSK